ncbi:uncharacterized protein LOC119283350 [Triticum dicoccoides]|uniref:uncharacterized protein LOC119283350 n=1 Tax=Triticum dicoccoides TaxID=85692 RepID=UPI00188E36D9|nr:uncharacterized protein LOC119283350 [Triticum dicoccoides]
MDPSSDSSSSFHPVDAGAAAGHQSWVLLDKNGGYADCENDTTAEAKMSTGGSIKVSFCLDPPPHVSRLFVHETVDSRREEEQARYSARVEVISKAKDLILLRRWAQRESEPYDEQFLLLVYHVAAGRGSKPSLTPIPATPTPLSSCVAILPFDDGGQFLLADLSVGKYDYPMTYQLHLFSSKTCVWSTRALTPLVDFKQDDMPCQPTKVIALGGTVLGWVDLWQGVVVLDVLGEDPKRVRFIPLPKPDFCRSEYHALRDRSPPNVFHRDVAYCADGFIKFVDMDVRFRHVAMIKKRPVIKTTTDLDHADTILDSELLRRECEGGDIDFVRVPNGWRIRTCYRHVSWDHWRKGHNVDVDEIQVYKPMHRAMLPAMWDDAARRWTVRQLEAGQPTLSIHAGDMVYLTMVSMLRHRRQKLKWTVGVDLGKKTIEILEPHSEDHAHVRAFTFSQHMNTPPPPHQNTWNDDMDGYYYNYNGSFYGHDQGYDDINYQLHPPAGWSSNLPQSHHASLNSFRSGSIDPVNPQLMYPVSTVNTTAHGQQCLDLFQCIGVKVG